MYNIPPTPLPSMLLSPVGLPHQVIQERSVKLDGNPGYCMAKRVRNQVYYEASLDLGCTGQGNQCKAGPCMLAAIDLFAGKGDIGLPAEVVRAMCPK